VPRQKGKGELRILHGECVSAAENAYLNEKRKEDAFRRNWSYKCSESCRRGMVNKVKCNIF